MNIVPSPRVDGKALCEAVPSLLVDPCADLGSSIYNEYASLLLAADDAKQALHRATISGKRSEISSKELETDERLGNLFAFKQNRAMELLLELRFAAELFPGRISELLDPAFRQELDSTQDALLDLECELDTFKKGSST